MESQVGLIFGKKKTTNTITQHMFYSSHISICIEILCKCVMFDLKVESKKIKDNYIHNYTIER